MPAFLEEVAQDLWNKYGSSLSDVHVIMPSRRACAYFRWYLSGVAKQTLLAPPILSMNDFVMQLSQLEPIDPITGVFKLYQSYRLFDKNPEHTLESFIPLGGALLRDFGMIDKNLNEEKASELFTLLDELKAIERWGEQLGEDIDKKQHLQDYFTFWRHTQGAYGHFRKQLLEEDIAYGGLIYRKVCDNLEQLLEERGVKQVILVGFNQMSRSEEEMLRQLIKLDKVTPYWDVEPWYIQHNQHEAGRFFRRYQRMGLMELPEKSHKPSSGATSYQPENPPEIRMIRVTNRVAQAKLAGQLLQEILEKTIQEEREKGNTSPDLTNLIGKRINHTAILMPDEALLLPLLHSLPNHIDGKPVEWGKLTNLTMGMRMYHTSLFSLIEAIFQMQERIDQEDEAVGTQIYYKDWNRIMSHPLIQMAAQELEWREVHGEPLFSVNTNGEEALTQEERDAQRRERWIDRLAWSPKWGKKISEQQELWLKQNRLYLSLKWLHQDEELGNLYRLLFWSWEKTPEAAASTASSQALAYFRQLLGLLLDSFQRYEDYESFLAEEGASNEEGGQLLAYRFEKTFLLQFHQMLMKLEKLLDQQGEQLSLPIFKQFLLEDMQQLSVPFSGEPLSPIQIMGLLESRALDFDHVVILSCNEGVLPQSRSEESLIPFALRSDIGIPTYKESDSAISYIFYRLFHKAKTVSLVYMDVAGKSQVKEQSRFLTQIEAEWPNASIKQEQALVEDRGDESETFKQELAKTEAVQELLRKRLARGISPSAINAFVRNPLTFFSRYILRIEEARDMEETMSRSTFGTLVHEVLENMLGEGFLKKPLLPKDWHALSADRAKIEEEVKKVIREKLETDDHRGGNLVLKKVASRLIERFFQMQKEEQQEAHGSTPMHIVSLEQGLTQEIHFVIGGKDIKIRLYGQADRIDRIGQVLRVVDYKTGAYHKKDMNVKEPREMLEDHSKGKAVQLMIYKYLLLKALERGELANIPQEWNEQPEAVQVQAGFYFLTNLDSKFIQHEISDAPEDPAEYMEFVEQWLYTWAERLLDASQGFSEGE